MKKITFTTHLYGVGPLVVDGYAVEYEGIQMAAHGMLRFVEPFGPHKKWGYEISEVSTGLNLVRHASTIKQAIVEAKSRIDQVGVERTKDIIAKTLLRKEVA